MKLYLKKSPKGKWFRVIILGIFVLSQSFYQILVSACSGSYTPTTCCLQTEVTVDSSGQYPKYIQGPDATAGGYYGGCGYVCVTVAPGEGGGNDHMWGVNFPGLSGVISGQVNYEAYSQQTAEAGCPYSRFASQAFTVLKDIAPPALTIHYPEENAIVKVEDKITGTATDDYQLGAIGVGAQVYSFLGSLPGRDDGGVLYYDQDDLRSAAWELPVSAFGQCESTLQEMTLTLWDAVRNTIQVKRSVYVDCSAPRVTIGEPVAVNPGIEWNDSDKPIVSGDAIDDLGVDKIWLTIKNESSNRWWNGTEWGAEAATVNPTKIVWTTSATWKYEGLPDPRVYAKWDTYYNSLCPG